MIVSRFVQISACFFESIFYKIQSEFEVSDVGYREAFRGFGGCVLSASFQIF